MLAFCEYKKTPQIEVSFGLFCFSRGSRFSVWFLILFFVFFFSLWFFKAIRARFSLSKVFFWVFFSWRLRHLCFGNEWFSFYFLGFEAKEHMLSFQIRQSYKTEVFHHSDIIDISGFDSGFFDEHINQSTRRVTCLFPKSNEKSGLSCGINFDFGEVFIRFRI